MAFNKNKQNETVGSTVARSDERIAQTGEVFTPLEVCKAMVDTIPESELSDPSSTFIDPSAGHGNFIVALRDKLLEYHNEKHIIDNMLFAVELMPDNHSELCERIGVSTDHPHYVCADALTYDYGFGQPVGLEAFF